MFVPYSVFYDGLCLNHIQLIFSFHFHSFVLKDPATHRLIQVFLALVHSILSCSTRALTSSGALSCIFLPFVQCFPGPFTIEYVSIKIVLEVSACLFSGLLSCLPCLPICPPDCMSVSFKEIHVERTEVPSLSLKIA